MQKMEVNGQNVEQVEVISTSVQQLCSSDGNMDSQVEQRIGMAS